MAVAYGTVTPPGLLAQQYPPPLLPKPGKDNVRLQKLLKRTAKKKASTQPSQSTTPFRSSLSPVNEASPDLEHSDNSTPPRTPETPFSLHGGIQQAQRFTVRPLYQHVASPYPLRAAFVRPASISPQMVAVPSHSYKQEATASSLLSATGKVDQPVAITISLPPTELEATIPAAELKKAAYESHAGLKPTTAGGMQQSKPKSPVPTPYSAAGGQAVIRPLIVLTPVVKSKSPRPTFKATEPSRSPKPMFDVPQIRMYTASTSYYETSRTPPVYDTAALTAIGSMVPQSKAPGEMKQELKTSEAGKGTTPTIQPPSSSDSVPQSKTPTLDAATNVTSNVNTIIPTIEIKGTTPTSDIKMITPSSDVNKHTPTSEIRRNTPTAEIKITTPLSDIKKATPTSVIRVKTPTYELSRVSTGRPRTPARAPTPAFEVSRPNPLLFAVTPAPVEPERSNTSQTGSAAGSIVSQSVKTTEPAETLLNGDIRSDVIPPPKPGQESIVTPKLESEPAKDTISPGAVSSLTPTSKPTPPVIGYQRPKTPTYEATRLLSTSPGYKRPKTPTYGAPRSSVSPVAFQRPKTPTQVSQKSSYRGLTPAEYAAYGGIKTFSPAFGIASSTPEEVKSNIEGSVETEILSQEPPVKGQSSDVSKVEVPSKDGNKLQMEDEKGALIPSIVVSQASAFSITEVEKGTVSHQVAAQHKTIEVQQRPKTESPTIVEKTSDKQKVQTSDKENKANIPEAKHPLPEGSSQDPLKAVKKLFGKDKVETTVQKPQTATKPVSEQTEQVKPEAAIQSKPKASSPAPGPPVKAPSADGTYGQEKEKKAKAAPTMKSAPDKKEGHDALPVAEPLLKVLQKPKGVKTKASGWSRLKKHMVVEQEEPKFPETGPQKETSGQDPIELKRQVEKSDDTPSTQDERETSASPKATKMWDAVLFQMFSSKENILHQIELNKSEEEKIEEEKRSDEPKEIPSFAYRLPVLLFSPKFDAKRLKEAASRPVTKISTVFEMGLIGRKGKEEEPKDFNRTARGFAAS